MRAPNQGVTALKLHALNLQKSPHRILVKSPRTKATKLPRSIAPPLPVSPGNQMEKVHGKSAERYKVALAAELVPELRGGGLDGSNHLAQRCAQRCHALLEAGPSSLQATSFLFGGWRFFGLAGIGSGIEVLLDQGHGNRPIRQEITRAASITGGAPKKQYQSVYQFYQSLSGPATRATNSPLSERPASACISSAGRPRRYSSNFLVISRASTTWRPGKTSCSSPSSLWMR